MSETNLPVFVPQPGGGGAQQRSRQSLGVTTPEVTDVMDGSDNQPTHPTATVPPTNNNNNNLHTVPQPQEDTAATPWEDQRQSLVSPLGSPSAERPIGMDGLEKVVEEEDEAIAGGQVRATDCRSDATSDEVKVPKVSAEDKMTAGAKTIHLSGGFLPIVFLFILGAILGLVSTVLAGVLLEQFASDTVQETVLAQGKSQIASLRAKLGPEFEAMNEFIEETKSTIASQIAQHGMPTDYDSFDTLLNQTVMGNFPYRIQDTHQLAGGSFVVMLPVGSTPQNMTHYWYSSMYYEPKRTGERVYAVEEMIPGVNGNKGNSTTLVAYNMKFENTTFPGIQIASILTEDGYLWEEPEWPALMSEEIADTSLLNTKQPQLPVEWSSPYDGFPYWYEETWEYFDINGTWFKAAAYKNMVQLLPMLQETLGSSAAGDSQIFVYQPLIRTIVGTSYEPESNRSAHCSGLIDHFDEAGLACMYLTPDQSTFPIIRDLFGQFEDYATWGTPGLDVASVQTKAEIDGTSYFVATELLINNGNQRFMVLWIRDAEAELEEMHADVLQVVLLCCGCIFGASILTMIIAIVGIINPLSDLSEDMDALAALDTDRFFTKEKLESGSIFREIQQLQTRFVAMAMSLQTFGLYVPREVVKEVLADPSKMTLTMDRRELAVLFADIADFTTLSERFDDDQPFFGKIMGTFFRKATQIIHKNGGTIDKFIGDCVMCFWGAPLAVDDPCSRSICAGLELLQVGREVSAEFHHADVTMHLRVGIHYGSCLVGNSGSEERLNYTALGDTVNTASRLEGANKEFKSAMMISREVMDASQRGDQLCFRALGAIALKGKLSTIDCFEIFGFCTDGALLSQSTMMKADSVHSEASESLASSSKNSLLCSGDTRGSSLGGPTPTDDSLRLKEDALATSKREKLSPEAAKAAALEGERQEKEANRLKTQRTEMVNSDESCAKIKKKFLMPTRLLTACAYNNDAVYFAETEHDYKQAAERYVKTQGILVKVLKDRQTLSRTMPLVIRRIKNFSTHVQDRVVAMGVLLEEADGAQKQ